MTTITIVRHGETIDNTNGIIQGQSQTELSPNGLLQAQKVAIYLMDIKYDYIYTSDLKRAFDTAFEISKYQPFAHLIKEPLLRERNFGEYTGVKMSEFAALGYPEPQNGETIEQVLNRAKQFYNKIIKNHSNKKIIVVTHNGFYRPFMAFLQKIDIKNVYNLEPLSNTAITEFTIDTKGNVNFSKINSTTHLNK